MRLNLLFPLGLAMLISGVVNACEIVSDEVARKVLGSEFMGNAPDPEAFCKFISAETFTMFSVRKEDAARYKVSTLPFTETEESITDKSRSYHLPVAKGAALHFVAGEVFWSLTAQPVDPSDDRDYLPLLREAAKGVLGK